MEKIRVLLIEYDLQSLQRTAIFLAKKPDVEIVGAEENGKLALEKILMVNPDIVISSVMMSEMDGFALLEHLRMIDNPAPPKVIIVTQLTRDHFIKKALDLGASYYMVKPIDYEVLYKRMVECVHFYPSDAVVSTPPAPPAASEQIDDILCQQGVSCHAKAYNYLRSALQVSLDLGELSGNVTKVIYPTVAKLHGTSSGCIERSIRHVIEKGWMNETCNPHASSRATSAQATQNTYPE